MFTLPGSKQWTTKHNQYIVCNLIFVYPRLIICLVAAAWETCLLHQHTWYQLIIQCETYGLTVQTACMLGFWLTSKRLPHVVFTDSSPFTEHPHWHVCTASDAVGSQALLGHLRPAVTQIVISTIWLVVLFLFFFSQCFTSVGLTDINQPLLSFFRFISPQLRISWEPT